MQSYKIVWNGGNLLSLTFWDICAEIRTPSEMF